MKTLLALVLFGGLTCGAADLPGTAGNRHYIQLIRGSDLATPPVPGATLVGPKVRKQLEPVFRWQYYWETQRTNITVDPGKTSHADLSAGLSVDIDLRQPGKRILHIYRDKKLVRTVVCARDKEFCIQGSKSDDGAVWFIVVRTEPPAT